MKKALLSFFIAAVLVAVPASAQTVVEQIVARVNDSIITQSDLQRGKQQAAAELKQSQDQGQNLNETVAERQKQVLRDLIDQQLLLDKGKDLGITGDTELIKQLDEIRKRNKMSSMEDLEKAARAQGVSFEDFKQELRDQIITQQVISQEVGRNIHITPTEVQQYYDQHKKEMDHPEQVRLSEIMISTAGAPQTDVDGKPLPPQEDPAKVAPAEQQANDLLEQLKKGADFAELAKKYSEGPTAAQGGDLGYFKRGALAKQLEDATFALKTGETTGVTRTKQGFVILKVTDHQPGGIPPLKDVDQDIQEAIYYQKLQPALREYLTKLREDAYIDIKPGYVDTGASPNESKPIYTAEADTKAKKLRKHKKFLHIF